MRVQLDRALAALCMGRSRREVLANVAAIIPVAAVLWFGACIFMALEPLP